MTWPKFNNDIFKTFSWMKVFGAIWAIIGLPQYSEGINKSSRTIWGNISHEPHREWTFSRTKSSATLAISCAAWWYHTSVGSSQTTGHSIVYSRACSTKENIVYNYCLFGNAFCEGNPLLTGGFPHIGPVIWKAFLYADLIMGYSVLLTWQLASAESSYNRFLLWCLKF